MIASYSSRELTPQEQEVRKVLAIYKMALINAHYRNWWHRARCLIGVKAAKEAEDALRNSEQTAKAIVNISPAHQSVVRVVSAQQPENVRDLDAFLALIH